MNKRMVIPLCFTGIAGAAAAGLLLSGILLGQHYFPESAFQSALCGGGMENPCLAAASSPWSKVYGVPVAALGLFYYGLALALSLISIAGGGKGRAGSAVIFPLAMAGTVMGSWLLAVQVYMSTFCPLCLTVFGCTIAMALLAFAAWRLSREEKDTLLSRYRELWNMRGEPAARALTVSALVIMIILGAGVGVHDMALEYTARNRKVPEKRVQAFLKFYRSLPVETLPDEPEGISVGRKGADLTITAFTDFNCTACYRLFMVERYLMSRFPGRVKVVYHAFPLDKVCNPHPPRTVFPNSCAAARAFFAMEGRGEFLPYLLYHYGLYKERMKEIVEGNVAITFEGYMKERGFSAMKRRAFLNAMNSEGVKKRLGEDIALGGAMRVRSVPTLFINGRRLEGVPPGVLMEALVRHELKRAR